MNCLHNWRRRGFACASLRLGVETRSSYHRRITMKSCWNSLLKYAAGKVATTLIPESETRVNRILIKFATQTKTITLMPDRWWADTCGGHRKPLRSDFSFVGLKKVLKELLFEYTRVPLGFGFEDMNSNYCITHWIIYKFKITWSKYSYCEWTLITNLQYKLLNNLIYWSYQYILFYLH